MYLIHFNALKNDEDSKLLYDFNHSLLNWGGGRRIQQYKVNINDENTECSLRFLNEIVLSLRHIAIPSKYCDLNVL